MVLPTSYPGFIDRNIDAFRNLASRQQDGTSVLLLKPSGQITHGGGIQISVDGEQYAIMQEFVQRLTTSSDVTCATTSAESFGDVELLGALSTYRKASLQLTGRLPSLEEIDSIREGGLSALPGALDALMQEDAFFERLKEIYNDIYLTDRYLRYNGFALQILSDDQFPYSNYDGDSISDEDRWEMTLAVAREPLELIAHIVRNERPFTEVLTADYTMVNPYSATVLNADVEFDDENNPNEWKEARIRVQTEDGMSSWPHAGILTSPMWLNRFPSSRTNRNRHRARMVYKFFLATDILRVAERPIDPEETAKYQNPTRDDPTCVSCHQLLDPIAGAFQKFDPNDPEEFDVEQEWYPEMFPPGFRGEDMQVSEFADAPQWLAQRIVSDERFVLANVYTVFTALMGREPLGYPLDAEAPDFDQQLAAWEAQDRLFGEIGEKFVDSNYNLKTIIRELILSPYYRAKNASALSEARASELGNVSTAALLTPEQLDRKITAVIGYPWARSWDRASYLQSDYNILYGGIDSDTITTRLTAPNGVVANVGWRMANEVACSATGWEFTRDSADRQLFPYVSVDHVPETDTGDSVPGAVDAIKQNIQYLHAHILGEDLELSDPEIERTYQLFFETWKEGKAGIADETLGDGLVWNCRGRWDRLTGEELPDEQRLDDDPNYTVRAWQAVITYLLSDYKFLYE